MSCGLVEVSSSSLERIRGGLRTGSLRAPLSRTALVAFGVRQRLEDLVFALEGHSREACLSVLDAVLAERTKHRSLPPELVWTGPERSGAFARDTAVVLRELFEKARKRVVLAGYSFADAESVLAPLHIPMAQHGVEAHFFVDVKQPSHTQVDDEAYGRAALEASCRSAGHSVHPTLSSTAIDDR